MECDLSSLLSGKEYLVLGALLAKEGLEYWLGKTDKVKAGSTLELVINLVMSGLKSVLGKKE